MSSPHTSAMSSQAIYKNVTVDDFDSPITFDDEANWTTPDPSKHLPFNQSSTPWFAGTYHATNVTGAHFTFDFEGTCELVYVVVV